MCALLKHAETVSEYRKGLGVEIIVFIKGSSQLPGGQGSMGLALRVVVNFQTASVQCLSFQSPILFT